MRAALCCKLRSALSPACGGEVERGLLQAPTVLRPLPAPFPRKRGGEQTAFDTDCDNVEGPCKRGCSICRSRILVYVRHALLNRGRRRSRRWMTEQGAAADNAVRDGASGGAGPFAGARASSHDAQAGSRKPGLRGLANPWRLPALHSPRFEGKQEKGRRARPGARKQSHGTAKRWLTWLGTIESSTRTTLMQLVRHHSHWGAFLAEVEDGRIVGVRPFEHDPDPSHLINAIPDGGAFADPHRAADGARGLAQARPRATARAAAASRSCRCRGTGRSIWSRARSSACGASTAMPRSWAARRAGRRPASSTRRARNCIASSRPSGGYVDQVMNYSFGAALAFLPHILGSPQAVVGPLTSWSSIARHARLMVLFGGANPKNTQVSKGGCASHSTGGWIAELARAGVEVINISPIREDGPERGPPGMDSDPAEHRHRDAARADPHAGQRRAARPGVPRQATAPASSACCPISWARATASRRTPTGRRRSPAFRPTRSARWRGAWRRRAPW